MLTGPPPRLRDDERVSEYSATWAPPSVRYECPIGECPWTMDHPGPDAAEGRGRTIEEIAFSAMRAHLLRAEAALREHLESHSLIEWVREVVRLSQQAAGTVTVPREDLECVYGYARHYDVDCDESMTRMRAVLGLPPLRLGCLRGPAQAP